MKNGIDLKISGLMFELMTMSFRLSLILKKIIIYVFVFIFYFYFFLIQGIPKDGRIEYMILCEMINIFSHFFRCSLSLAMEIN